MDDALKEVDKIESIREKNNKNWMGLLRLAIKYAPENEVIEILEAIVARDKQVAETCYRLLVLLSR